MASSTPNNMSSMANQSFFWTLKGPANLMHPTKHQTCSYIQLDTVNWPLIKLVVIVFELMLLLIVNGILPRLVKDLLRSQRMPAYLKCLVGMMLFCMWAEKMIRIFQLFLTRPEFSTSWSPFFVHAYLLREALTYTYFILFTCIITTLFCEITSIAYRQSGLHMYFAIPVCFFTPFLCGSVVGLMNWVNLTIETMFVIKFSTILVLFIFQYHIDYRIKLLIKLPGFSKKGYLIGMQKSYRRAVRGSRYMRLQLKISFVLFICQNLSSLSAYFWAFHECNTTWFQLLMEGSEFLNVIFFTMTIFNCSHYIGGKIHRLIAKVFPNQKYGSTASTEPLYYNTEMLNPQEAHFRQLSEMWSTKSSAQPNAYTVDLSTTENF